MYYHWGCTSIYRHCQIPLDLWYKCVLFDVKGMFEMCMCVCMYVCVCVCVCVFAFIRSIFALLHIILQTIQPNTNSIR